MLRMAYALTRTSRPWRLSGFGPSALPCNMTLQYHAIYDIGVMLDGDYTNIQYHTIWYIYSYYMLLLRFRKWLSSQKSCRQKSTCFISNSIQVKAFTFSWDSSNSKVTRTWPSKDGFITNMVVYPSICAVFGYDIRQAIGGDFGFSRRAAEAFLAQTWPAKVFGLRKPATQAENDTTFDGQSGGCKPYMFLKQVFSCVYLKLLYSLYIIIIRYSVFWEWSVLSVVSGWNFHQFFHLFALPQGEEMRHWYLHDNDGAQARIFDGWSGAATQNPQPKLAKNQEHAPRGQGGTCFSFFLVLNLQNILPVTRSDPLAKCYVNVNVMSPKINYLCPNGFLKLGGGWNWDIEKGMNNIITIKSVGYVL